MGTSAQVAYVSQPVAASVTVLPEAHLCYNSAGDVILAADASGAVYAGTSGDGVTIDNSTGAAAAKSVKVIPPRENPYHKLLCSSATKAWNGQKVFWTNTVNTVALAATTTNDVCAGTVIQFIDATHVLVDTTATGAVPAAA